MLAGAPVSSRLSALQAPASPAQPTLALNREFLTRNCVACHNQRLQTAGLALDDVDVVADWRGRRQVGKGRAQAAHRLDASSGPAAARCGGKPSPSSRRWSRRSIVRRRRTPNPGPSGRSPPEPRRVRQRHPRSAGVEIDVRALLPADDADEHGFDNIADVLSVSPALLERYMSAAQKVTRRRSAGRCRVRRSRPTTSRRLLVQDARLSEDLPFGSRGGDRRAPYFPVDGEYSIKIRLQTQPLRLHPRPRPAASARGPGGRRAGQAVHRRRRGPRLAGARAASPARSSAARSGRSTRTTPTPNLEARFTAKAGTRLVGVSFVDEPSAVPEGVLQPRQVSYPLAIDEMLSGRRRRRDRRDRRSVCRRRRRRHAEPAPHLRRAARVQRQRRGRARSRFCRRSRAAPTGGP